MAQKPKGASTDTTKVARPPKLPARKADAHKGDFGRLLILGGSQGMIGAVALACNGALRAGAGLVTFAVPRTIQRTVAVLCPCATSVPLACDDEGAITHDAVHQAAAAAERADVLAVGPGMGVAGVQKDVLTWALGADKPLVVDADGLTNLAAMLRWNEARKCPLVLTPHPGEFSRLTDRKVPDIQADRVAAAVRAVRKWTDGRKGQPPLVCVLKGAGTVITDGRRVYVNRTGNPGMATGGSGDVLTGVIAALLGQGMESFEAACLGAHVHGRAGDLAAAKLGEISTTAWDLLDFLPAAIREACR